MSPALSQDRIDEITAQYVWAIQSDSGWYHKATDAAKLGDYGKFRRHTGNFINRIARQQNEKISGVEWAYVLLELWAGLGCKREDCLKDPGTLQAHYEELLCVERDKRPTEHHLDRVATNIETITKENPMTITVNPTAVIETKTVIFGQDAALMSEQELIDAIKRVEGKISSLKEVKTSSKKIAANIKELEKQLDAIVAVLDARE